MRLDLLVIVIAQPVGEPVAERGARPRRCQDGPEVQGVAGADERADADQHDPERQHQGHERQRLTEREHEHDRRRPFW